MDGRWEGGLGSRGRMEVDMEGWRETWKEEGMDGWMGGLKTALF